MIKGITVLNTYKIVNPDWHDTMFPSAVFAFVTIFGIALIIYLLRDPKQMKDAFIPSVFVILFTLFGMVASIYGFTHLPENKYQTTYEVTIGDDVNFNEFNSKYEVVKQEGLIYTIIEKPNKG